MSTATRAAPRPASAAGSRCGRGRLHCCCHRCMMRDRGLFAWADPFAPCMVLLQLQDVLAGLARMALLSGGALLAGWLMARGAPLLKDEASWTGGGERRCCYTLQHPLLAAGQTSLTPPSGVCLRLASMHHHTGPPPPSTTLQIKRRETVRRVKEKVPAAIAGCCFTVPSCSMHNATPALHVLPCAGPTHRSPCCRSAASNGQASQPWIACLNSRPQLACPLARAAMQAENVVESVVDAARDAQAKAQTAAAVAKTTTGAGGAVGGEGREEQLKC